MERFEDGIRGQLAEHQAKFLSGNFPDVASYLSHLSYELYNLWLLKRHKHFT